MSELVDASRQFAQRRLIGGVLEGELSVDEVTRVINSASAGLIEDVFGFSSEIADLFEGDEDRLSAKIVDDSDEETPEPVLSANQVYPSIDGIPILHITSGVIFAIGDQLKPYFEYIDEKDIIPEAQRQRTILEIATRLGVASWVFDRLDPRLRDLSEERSIRYTALEAGLEGLTHNSSDINAAMDVLRFRFIGYLGFARLLEDPRFRTVQQVFQAYFDEAHLNKREASDDKAYSLKFALAHMLSRQEARDLIRRLGKINKIIDKYK